MTRFYHNSILFCRSFSVLYFKLIILFPAILILLSISVSSCEEKATIIGSNLLPSSDFVNIKADTSIKVTAYTKYIKGVVTNNMSYSYLGRLSDPYFGETKADFVGQLRMYGPNGISGAWPGGGPFAVDSVKFFFTIVGAKGIIDSNLVRQIRLFEITEQLNSSVKYFSNRDPNAGKDLGTFNLPLIPKDTTQNIDIILPVSFGEYLIRDTTRLTQENNTNDFRSFFKGLYITMLDAPSPFLVAIQISTTSFPFIRVYYSSYKKGGNLSYDFVINTNSVRYNRYNHIFGTASSPAKVDTSKFGQIDSLVYLQAFNGVYPRLTIPGLTNIKNNMTRISVNKARLTFSVKLDDVNFKISTIPPKILMRYSKSDTAQYMVPDYYVSPAFYDGSFNSTAATYSFNLASFVQGYLEGKIPDPVVEMYFPEGEYRNVILRANHNPLRPKFEFTYTRF